MSATIDAAPGAVIVIGRVTGSKARVALEQRSHGRWVYRASGTLRKYGYFQLRWTDSPLPAGGLFRVAALTGARVIGLSGVLRPSARPLAVSSQLRPGAIEVRPGSVRVVSGSPTSGDAVLRLPPGDRTLRAGQVVVENASAESAGMIVVVKRAKKLRGGGEELWTAPGALKDAFSSFDADLSGTLASLSGSLTPSQSGDLRAEHSGSQSVGKLLPTQLTFSCKSQGRTFSLTSHVDFSSLQVGVIVDLSAGYVSISLSGQPTIDLNATFSQAATCTAEAAVVLGIKRTPLEVTLGPDFTLDSQGTITADWTWDPYFSFTYSKGVFTGASTQTSFANHGGLTITGNTQLTANFDFLDKVGGDGLDLQGLIGPEVDAFANVNNQGQLCVHAQNVWKAGATGSALGLHLDLGTLEWGFDNLVPFACTGGGNSGGSGGGGSPGGSSGYGLASCVSATLCRAIWEPAQIPWPSQPQPWYAYSETSGNWSGPTTLMPQDPPPALKTLSCAASGFCMVIADGGDNFDTSGGGWQAGPASGLNAEDVSCTSASFCMAVGLNGEGDDVAIYNGTSWSAPVDIDRGALNSVSCTSATFCAAVGLDGDAVTYNGSTWTTPQPIDPPGPGEVTSVMQVSCASATLCVAVGLDGNAEVYNGTSWSSPRQVDTDGGSTEISCAPGTSFCAGVDNDGRAYAYRSGVWTTPGTIDYAVNLHSVSCASSTDCVAVDGNGAALTYNGSTWSAPHPFAS